MATRPLVVVIAGPNGAGKSTTAPRLLQGAWAVREFVNADTIAQGLSAFRPAEVGIAAGRVMLLRIRSLARGRADFAFETTLATRTYAPWLGRLRASGYRAHIVFLALPSAELAIARVAERVRAGGHDVAEEVIRRRFAAGLGNLLSLYDRAVDSWEVLDNSSVSGPRVLARRRAGKRPEFLDRAAWGRLLEQRR
jgi:predicted ABC-type ATPase